MTAYVRNPLTVVWALLTAVTVVSWLTARGSGSTPVADAAVTVVVLSIAALKSLAVIWWFMEVRHAPSWLRVVTIGWAITLFAVLLGVYFVSP